MCCGKEWSPFGGVWVAQGHRVGGLQFAKGELKGRKHVTASSKVLALEFVAP